MGPSEQSLEARYRQDCHVLLHRLGTAQLQRALFTWATM